MPIDVHDLDVDLNHRHGRTNFCMVAMEKTIRMLLSTPKITNATIIETFIRFLVASFKGSNASLESLLKEITSFWHLFDIDSSLVRKVTPQDDKE